MLTRYPYLFISIYWMWLAGIAEMFIRVSKIRHRGEHGDAEAWQSTWNYRIERMCRKKMYRITKVKMSSNIKYDAQGNAES